MNVHDIAGERVFLQSATYAALAASNSALLPAQVSPVPASTTASSLAPATAAEPAPASLASYNAAGAGTVYGSANEIGTLLNSLA